MSSEYESAEANQMGHRNSMSGMTEKGQSLSGQGATAIDDPTTVQEVDALETETQMDFKGRADAVYGNRHKTTPAQRRAAVKQQLKSIIDETDMEAPEEEEDAQDAGYVEFADDGQSVPCSSGTRLNRMIAEAESELEEGK